MITPTIYDWPESIVPASALFYAGGQVRDGGVTAGGVLVLHPEPGGRAIVEMQFNYTADEADRVLASWLFSKVSNGNVFRFRLPPSLQLVTAEDIGLDAPEGYEESGIPWDGDVYWDNDLGWEFEPGVFASAAALEGETALMVDMAGLAPGIRHGHVVGICDHAYMVDDIEYDGDAATITVNPPLRGDIDTGDFVTFRPRMIGTVSDPATFRAMFEYGFLVRPGSATLTEVLV